MTKEEAERLGLKHVGGGVWASEVFYWRDVPLQDIAAFAQQQTAPGTLVVSTDSLPESQETQSE